MDRFSTPRQPGRTDFRLRLSFSSLYLVHGPIGRVFSHSSKSMLPSERVKNPPRLTGATGGLTHFRGWVFYYTHG